LVTSQAVPAAVIIPAYNAEAFLDQALASVAGQSRPPTEVLVGDDCSADRTVEVAERWADRLPIRVVRSEVNAGPAVARNQAIARSTSPLLALLDADDIWLPDHLATLAAIWERHGGLAMADSLGWIPGEASSSRPWSKLEGVPDPRNQLLVLYRRNFVFIGCLFAREDFELAGGFRAQFKGTEDWDLWIRMVRNGVRVTAAEHPTVLYRLRPGSLSSEDEMVNDEVGVLEAALAEARDAKEARAARVGLRLRRAQRHLFAAYERFDEGQTATARLHGFAALSGSRRVALRGLAMGVAPRTTAERRAGARATPAARLAGE
jgi:glycosyltransferase involved in cell wall biosynthesis